MARKALAIIAILLFTSFAWLILGGTILSRTGSAGPGLSSRVQSSWGKPQVQTPPAANGWRKVQRVVQENVGGQILSRVIEESVAEPMPLEQSRIRVDLDLEQRQKGLLWFPTYRVGFSGRYLFRNTTASDRVMLKLVFPAPDAIYDDLVFKVDGRPLPVEMSSGAVTATITIPPGSVIPLEIGYRSQGLQTWNYSFGENIVQVRDFVLEMKTDFDAIDFPQETISPASKRREAGDGWLLTWKYSNLVTGKSIGMIMPEKLQPGPLAGRISFFAPVSLLFFFFAIFIITSLRRIPLHPMHYFFLATSFFAFHLLLAYLVDHISIHLAFAICSAVSLGLVVSYLRIVVGPQFAFREAALAQLVYLVGFSYAFFFKGFTGLAITTGAILSLFLVMQLTARIDWSQAGAMPHTESPASRSFGSLP